MCPQRRLCVPPHFGGPTVRVAGRIVTTSSADVPLKGLAHLVEALAEVRGQNPDAHLVVTGFGTWHTTAVRMTEALAKGDIPIRPIQDYLKAQAFHDSDPHGLSSISRVYAVWAQELTFEADARAKAIGDTPDLEQRAQLLTMQRRARRAKAPARRCLGNEGSR